MANRLIKKITARLTGASTAETFDIYDDAAVHSTDVVDALTSTDATKVLSAKQGKALNDALVANTQTVTTGSISQAMTWSGTIDHNHLLRKGNVVEMSIRQSGITTDTAPSGVWYTVPTGFKPAAGVYLNGYMVRRSDSAMFPIIATINMNGNVSLEFSSSTSNAPSIIYIAGSYNGA